MKKVCILNGSVYDSRNGWQGERRDIFVEDGIIVDEFPNPDHVLVPGQYVPSVIQIGESKERLVVPQSAVQADRSGYFVLVVNEHNIVSIKRVKMGDRKGVFWVVEEGLTEGDAVIYQGIQKVRPDSTVKPVRKDFTLPHLK